MNVVRCRFRLSGWAVKTLPKRYHSATLGARRRGGLGPSCRRILICLIIKFANHRDRRGHISVGKVVKNEYRVTSGGSGDLHVDGVQSAE